MMRRQTTTMTACWCSSWRMRRRDDETRAMSNNNNKRTSANLLVRNVTTNSVSVKITDVREIKRWTFIVEVDQGRIQDSPPGGRQHMILPNFAKNCIKLRKFWAVVGGGGGAHPKSATENTDNWAECPTEVFVVGFLLVFFGGAGRYLSSLMPLVGLFEWYLLWLSNSSLLCSVNCLCVMFLGVTSDVTLPQHFDCQL